MITCPACGKENEDSAFECRRCRAPLREDMPEDHHAGAAPVEEAALPPEPGSDSLGEVCRRCEAYNEPGVRVCTNCGFQLFAEALAAAAPPPEEAPMDKTPPQAWAPVHDVTPPDGSSSLSEELSALALSDQEAAEAGMFTSNGEEVPLDKTPPQAYAPPEPEPEPEPVRAAPPARGKVAEVAAGAAGVAVGAAAAIVASRRAPAPEPAAAPAEKPCSNCGAANPPAAKFCFDCGTPFARKAPEPKAAPPPPAPASKIEPVRTAPPQPFPKIEPLRRIEPIKLKAEPPPSIQVAPSIQVEADLTDSTAESAPVSDNEPLPEEVMEPAPLDEPLPEEEPVAAEPLAEPLEEEALPPFQASLVVEKGASQGTAFLLARLENSVGGAGAQVELTEDPFIAPHAATLLFVEDHLTLRDEGSANGVFLKVRESAPLEPGDLFVAGERLFRYDGPAELAKDGESETPFLGAPRPQGAAVRLTEVLAAGKTGRTCHRAGPAIAIGRTGCDMNFPADALMAAKHAEVRLAEDGTATLVDLGHGPSGVFIRVRAQSQQDLASGDILLVGDQQLRVEVA